MHIKRWKLVLGHLQAQSSKLKIWHQLNKKQLLAKLLARLVERWQPITLLGNLWVVELRLRVALLPVLAQLEQELERLVLEVLPQAVARQLVVRLLEVELLPALEAPLPLLGLWRGRLLLQLVLFQMLGSQA
jgi:hypothetical protein